MIQDEQLANLKALVLGREFSLYRAVDLDSKGYVRQLEDLFCTYFNIKHAIAVSSATAGLHLSCIAWGVKDKEVITTPVTFSATASSIVMAGGTPLFKDIDPDTYCIKDVSGIVIPVHLHGNPADLDTIKGTVIEDCAQAIGAEYKGRKVGTFGDCGVFSFHQTKTIISGQGGMVITNNDEIAEKIKLLRNHAECKGADFIGFNYLMTELQASVLIPQFKRLDEINSRTIELAEYFTDKIKDCVITPYVLPNCKHVYYNYAIKTLNRDELQRGLLNKGVYFGKGGYKPLYMLPFYEKYKTECPVADDCYKTVMFTNIVKPPITEKELDRIAEIIWENHT